MSAVQVDAAPQTLGELCEINPPKPNLRSLPDDMPILFVPMAAVDDVTGTITDPQIRTLGEVRNKSYRTFAPGDVLFAKITPCMENGKSAIVPPIASGIGFGSTEFHVLRPKNGTDPRLIWHFVRQETLRREARENMSGSVGQARVPAHFLDATEIQLPVESAQDALANLLDVATTRMRTTDRHLTKARSLIDRFRQAVLVAACSGRLTADWRERHSESTTQPVGGCRDSTRLDSALVEDVPANWSVATLGMLSTFITSGSRGWARYYSETGPLFIRAQNINTDKLTLDELAHVQLPKSAEGQRTRIHEVDLLVTITGANVARAAVVDHSIGEAYVNQHIALVRLSSPEMAKYLHLWLISPAHGRKQLLDDAYGAGRPGLNLDNLRTLPVAVPPKDEQEEIVRRTAMLLTRANRLLTVSERADVKVEQVSQALLTKAFRGELIPNCEMSEDGLSLVGGGG